MTPLQMAMVAAAIANGGVLMAPRLMTSGSPTAAAPWCRRCDPQEIGEVMDAREGGGPDGDDGRGGERGHRHGRRACRAPGSRWPARPAPPRPATARTEPGLVHRLRAGRGPEGRRRGRGGGHPGTGGVVAAPIAAQVMRAALDVGDP